MFSRQPLVAEVIKQDGQPGALGAPLARGALVLSLTQPQAKVLSVLLKPERPEPSSRGVVRPLFQVNETTRRILENFSSISNEVLLLKGKRQKTVQLPSRAILVLAEFPEPWPRETGISDLKQFLSILSLFERPALDFKADAMVVTDADRRGLSIRYRYPTHPPSWRLGTRRSRKTTRQWSSAFTGDLSFETADLAVVVAVRHRGGEGSRDHRRQRRRGLGAKDCTIDIRRRT